ncbi:hypothetical protein EDB86DRAFT_3103496 [Lactarius hatsudake]|nr:hypothetical protein EDB86DRAFT_3103496 [Lactarius hatsudake]
MNPAILGMQDTSSPPTPAHTRRTHVFHCRYGSHLAELVAPSPDTFELVNSWLKHHGVSPSSISGTHGGGWLTVSSVPVSQAKEMLASYQLARCTCANHRTGDALRLYASAAADSTHPLGWSSGIAREGVSGEPKDVLSRHYV